MLRNTTIILILFLFIASFSNVLAGNNSILLKSRTIETVSDFPEHMNDVINPDENYRGYFYRLIQFNDVLREEQRVQIEAAGIKLLGYIPHNAFYAAIPTGLNLSVLLLFNPRTIIK